MVAAPTASRGSRDDACHAPGAAGAAASAGPQSAAAAAAAADAAKAAAEDEWLTKSGRRLTKRQQLKSDSETAVSALFRGTYVRCGWGAQGWLRSSRACCSAGRQVGERGVICCGAMYSCAHWMGQPPLPAPQHRDLCWPPALGDARTLCVAHPAHPERQRECSWHQRWTAAGGMQPLAAIAGCSVGNPLPANCTPTPSLSNHVQVKMVEDALDELTGPETISGYRPQVRRGCEMPARHVDASALCCRPAGSRFGAGRAGPGIPASTHALHALPSLQLQLSAATGGRWPAAAHPHPSTVLPLAPSRTTCRPPRPPRRCACSACPHCWCSTSCASIPPTATRRSGGFSLEDGVRAWPG